jgi:general secretion pathway protein I
MKHRERIHLLNRGFTLLEVMIALAILSLVAVAFLHMQAGSLRLIDESGQISLATLLAKEKMAELESLGFPEEGKSSGKGEDEFTLFRWERVVSGTEMVMLRKAVVRILWTEGGRERNMELTAYFAKRA